jgi:hypothetical protein
MELDDGYIKCCPTHIPADSHLVSDQRLINAVAMAPAAESELIKIQ